MDNNKLGLDSLFRANEQQQAEGGRAKSRAVDAQAFESIVAQEGADHLKPVISAIYGQESGSGANARTSIDGAQGGMQIIPATFQRYAKPGERIDNPDDNMRVGVRIIKDLANKFGNDPAKIATGYFSGEGNVNPGQGSAWKNDRADGNGKSVSGYVSDVLKRAGVQQPSQTNLPDLDKAPNWADIVAKPDWRTLTPAERAETKAAYFDYWIAPHAGGQRDAIRAQFLAQKDPAAANENAGMLSDAGNLLGIGVNSMTQNVRELVGRIPVVGESIVRGVDAADKYLTGRSSEEILKSNIQQGQAALSPEMQAAQQKKWWDSEAGTFGDAWKDPRAYASGVLQSLPEQVVTMFPAMRLAKGIYASKIAAGVAPEAAAKAAARAAAIAGGASEGALAGAASSIEVRDKIMAMTPQQLQGSDAMAALISQGMSFEDAKRQIANDSATQAFITSGLVTGAFGGFGDRVLARALTEGVGKSLLGRVGRGVVAEGVLEEFPQEFGSAVAENMALQNANPAIGTTDDALNRALGGLATGGLQGGAMAALGRNAPEQKKPAPVVTPDGRIESAEAPPAAPTTPEQPAPTEPAAAVEAAAPTQPEAGADSFTDQDVLDFADTQRDRLLAKRDGTRETVVTEEGAVDQDVPGAGLTPAEERELAALEQAGDNPAALRGLYGFNQQESQNVQVPQEPEAVGPAPSESTGQAPDAAQEPAADATGGRVQEGQVAPAGARPVAPATVDLSARTTEELTAQLAGSKDNAIRQAIRAELAKRKTNAQQTEEPSGPQAVEAQQAEAQGSEAPAVSAGAVAPENKPKNAGKEDLERLFGIDKKRQAALDRIAKGTAYFATPDKAKDFIKKNGLADTHEAVKNGKRFEIVAKGAEPVGEKPKTEKEAKSFKDEQKAEKPRATVIDNTDTNKGEYIVRGSDGRTNLARFEIGRNAQPIRIKYFHEAQATRIEADAAIEAFMESRKDNSVKQGSGDQAPKADDFDAMFDDVLAEELAKDAKQKTESAGTVAVPASVSEAIGSQLQKQKSRIARLKNEAEKAGTLEEKKAAQLKVTAAESTLRQLRVNIFNAEDAAVKAVKAGDVKQFAGYADLFPAAAEEIAKLTGQNDELDAEMRGYEAKAGKPKTEKEARAQRTAAESLASAAKNTAAGLDAAIDGLGKLFGGPGRLNSGLSFDEETYAKAKPLFLQAIANLKDAGSDLKEAMRTVVRMVLDKFGAEAAGNMKPYVVRFIEETAGTEKRAEDAATETDLFTPEGKFKVAKEIADFLIGDGSFKTIIEARKKISEIIGRPIEAATELAKQADEAIETGVVLAGREIVEAGRKQGRSPEVIYSRLVDLYNRQPNLSVRSSTSVRDQAYSTPVPLAYLASELAGITYKSKVLEPTAGNGMLLVGAKLENSVANELNPKRAAMLDAMGFKAEQKNAATENMAPAKSQDAVIANPPFGVTKDAQGNTIIYEVKPNYGTREVDHAIAFKALATMKDDGRAVLIVGGVQSEAEEARRDDYRGKSKRTFYFNLYNDYNVVDHFTVDGDLYSKQGASYPVDVIVIDGRGKSARDLPAADLPKIIRSYDELKEKLNGANGVESRAGSGTDGVGSRDGQAGGADKEGLGGGTGGSSVQSGTQSQSGGAGSGVRGNATANGGRPESGGQRAGAGQLESANAPQSGAGGKQPVSGEGKQQQPGRSGSNRANRSDSVGGSSVVAGERVESGLTDRRGEEQETETQVAYAPHSQASSVGTLVPKAMRDAIDASLQKIEDRVGNLDQYVADSLQMESDTLSANFSAEQVDALALAIDNAEAGKGFIIGDQTGIGKGRVVAAMIRYALVNDKTPIFVTEKPNLYSDMIRDLDDIGMTDELALDTKKPRIFITNGGESIPYTLIRNKNGEVTETNLTLKSPKTGKALDEMMRDMATSDSLGEYRVIFTTYSQLQTVKGKATERQRFVRQFGNSNYMIFDESHNAGGSGEQQARTKEQREAEKKGESTATGRSAFVRDLVKNAFGTFFSSATYAKRPDVMDLYSSTNMSLAVDRPRDLGEAIKKGGVPMQQVVATMLTQDGQYIRRERTFAGVSYDTVETKVDKETAENMASAMRSILAFSRAKEAVIAQMQKEMDKQGATLAAVGGEASSVQGANFGSIMHNLIDQMLLSLKAQDSVKHAIGRLKAGEKVVMTVSNTMGSFLQKYAEEMGLNTGDPVALSFADLYGRYLEKQRIVKIKSANGQVREHRLTDDELGPSLVAMFQRIKQQIAESGFGSAPISPIDYMHAELRKAGYKTDEITGRTIGLNYEGGQPVLASRTANIKQRVGAVRGFNNGDTDVLILNQAGSTGLSLHASSKFKDQRKRHMIVVQAEKNIDTHMQMLGRVHRTGQVTSGIVYGDDATYAKLEQMMSANDLLWQDIEGALGRTLDQDKPLDRSIALQHLKSVGYEEPSEAKAPEGKPAVFGMPAYSQMMADIPAEMRPAAVLLKKMASLNANTTASRKSAVTAEGVVDFMNDYGGQVVHEYLRDNQEVHQAIGGSKVIKLVEDPTEEASEDDIRKLTGYIPILPIAQQETIYKDLIDRYNELLERENSLGTNKLEAKAMDLDAETIDSQPITEQKESNSIFAAPAQMERVDVKRTVKPYSTAEITDMVKERLGDKTAAQTANDALSELAVRTAEYSKKVLGKMQSAEAPDPIRIEAARNQIDMALNMANTVLSTYRIGDTISITDNNGQVLYGAITDISNSGRTTNPAAGSDWKMQIALANGDAKSLKLSFSQLSARYQLAKENTVNWYNAETQALEPMRVLDIFDKGATVRREKRWMVTGNILAGFSQYNGQIVSYTKKDGTIGQGVLMSRQFDFAKEQKNVPVKIKSADAASQFFGATNDGATIGTPDAALRIIARGPVYTVIVPSSKKEGGTYFLDPGLTNAIGGDFYKTGGVMTARNLTEAQMRATVEYLLKQREETLVALSNQDKAREMFAVKGEAGPREFNDISRPLPATIKVDGKDRPTRNSEGRQIHPTAEGVRNFWKWFGDSKVVDEQGRPLVVYHGTRHSFDEFNPDGRRGKPRLHYFSDDPAVASEYAGDVRYGTPNVMPSHVSLQKPFTFNANGEQWGSLTLSLFPAEIAVHFDERNILRGREGRESLIGFSEVIRGALAAGYDGVIADGIRDGGGPYGEQNPRRVVVASRPTQIKSAIGNTGAFDGATPSILNDLSTTPAAAFADKPEQVRANALTKLKGLERRRNDGKITEAEYRLGVQQLIGKLEQRNEARDDRRMESGRRRGADWIVSQLRRGVADNTVPRNEADFAEWLLDQNPNLANDLGIAMSGRDGKGTTGNYNPLARIVTLFTSANLGNGTAVHEILHHTERMMPGAVQSGVMKEWQRAWDAAYKAGDAKLKTALNDMLAASLGDKEANARTQQAFENGTLKYEQHYQLFSPSEFWAVNATSILSGRFAAKGSWVKTAIQWFKEFMQRAKAVFGLRSDATILKALDAVMKGEGVFQPGAMMMAERVAEDVTGATVGEQTYNDIARKVQNNVVQFFGNRNESLKTFGAFNKTLSTQYHKALKDRDYGRVFGFANAMQNHVSIAAIRPAELAPGVLPRVDDVKSALKTVWKGKQANADIDGATKAIFAGTLYGKDVMQGKVFSDDDLRNQFKLTDTGIALYKQARAAIDASLDELAAAEAFSMAQGFVPKVIRRGLIDNPQSAPAVLAMELGKQIKMLKAAIKSAETAGNEEQKAQLEASLEAYINTQRTVDKIFTTAKNLKAAGYAPLMRFGKYTVTVQAIDPETGNLLRDENGDSLTEFYGQYETEGEAISVRNEKQALYKDRDDLRVTTGVKSQTAHELYAGISPETLALFSDAIGAGDTIKKYYQLALSERSALKRRLERKGTAGFSEDMPRVLSNFITSNARFAAQRYYLRDLNNAIKFIPKEKGDVLDEAMSLKKFMNDPNDPGAPISSVMFAWFLGGSVAAAMVNMTQPIMMTAPYLSQHGVGRATAAIAKAMPYALGKKQITDTELRDALKRASQEGVVDAQEIFHLYSQGAQSVASGLANTLAKIPGLGGKIKAGSESARARINAFLTLWGSMFSLAEKFNRKLTFIAAWEVAKAKGEKDPFAFAVRAVNETQGIYNKVNRPNWARGTFGRTLLTFKQFSIMYVELLSRMWKRGGPEGKRAALMMLAVLMLAAGEEGLPFAQDLDDLIDTIGQMFGLDTNMRRNKRRLAHEILGKTGGDLFLYGISSQLPLDVAGRLGVGNLIPGTGILKPSDKELMSRNVAEIFGPAAGMATQIGDAYEAFTEGNTKKALTNLAPKAVKDVLSGLDMADKGYATDAVGRKTTEVTAGEAAIKSVGFNPTTVAQLTRKTMPIQQDVALQRRTESAILDQWVRGITDKDQAMIDKAQARLNEWNRANPDTPIQITGAQIKVRIRNQGLDKETRVLKSAPREMRGRVAEGLDTIE
jgi:hypothetical protein